MIATHHRKVSLRIWKLALFDVLHPSAIHSDWNAVFGFAGDGTGVTPNAPAVIDDKSKISQEVSRGWSLLMWRRYSSA